MSTNHPEYSDDLSVRIADVFRRMEIPQGPTDEAAIQTIFQPAGLSASSSSGAKQNRILKMMAPLAALAAGLVIAVALWSSSQNIVFAQVIEQIKKADVVAFTI